MRPTLNNNYSVACTFCNTLYAYLPRCGGIRCEALVCPTCCDPESAWCLECAAEQRKRDQWAADWTARERDELATILLAGALIGIGAICWSSDDE
jgi:hypothetical protein